MQLFILKMDLYLKIWTLLACRLFTHKSRNSQNVDVAITTTLLQQSTVLVHSACACRLPGCIRTVVGSDVKNQTAALPNCAASFLENGPGKYRYY